MLQYWFGATPRRSRPARRRGAARRCCPRCRLELAARDGGLRGHFYYRYRGGESPADCYDRVSGFLESFVRSIRKSQWRKTLLVTHGLGLRVFVMRMFHMTVEQVDAIANPHNCDIITVAPRGKSPQFKSVRWDVDGCANTRRRPPP